MQSYRIGVLKGDGIGPEIVQPSMCILEAALSQFHESFVEFVEWPIGFETIHSLHQDSVPTSTKVELKKCHGWILGPHDSASYPDIFKERRNPSGELRHTFDLFANISPISIVTRATKPCTRRRSRYFSRKYRRLLSRSEHVSWGRRVDGYTRCRYIYRCIYKKAITRIAHAAFQSASAGKRLLLFIRKMLSN